MSGEAFEGAHRADIGDVVAGTGVRLTDLKALRDALRQQYEAQQRDKGTGAEILDIAKALSQTITNVERLIERLTNEVADIQAGFDEIQGLLRAFAYWRSGDSSEEQFREAMRKFAATH